MRRRVKVTVLDKHTIVNVDIATCYGIKCYQKILSVLCLAHSGKETIWTKRR